MLLTQEERNKFSTWLEQDIESNRLLIQQLDKVSYGDMLASNLKKEMFAQILVLNKLRKTESFELQSPVGSNSQVPPFENGGL